MSQLPEQVIQAWQGRNGPAALATVSADGQPNVIYTSFVQYIGDHRFVFVDHFMTKTRENILGGSPGALLFMSADGRSSYQLKGSLELQESGEIFEQAVARMPPTLPSRAVVILQVESVYSGAERLDS